MEQNIPKTWILLRSVHTYIDLLTGDTYALKFGTMEFIDRTEPVNVDDIENTDWFDELSGTDRRIVAVAKDNMKVTVPPLQVEFTGAQFIKPWVSLDMKPCTIEVDEDYSVNVRWSTDEQAEFFGIYGVEPAGTSFFIADMPTKEAAINFILLLNNLVTYKTI